MKKIILSLIVITIIMLSCVSTVPTEVDIEYTVPLPEGEIVVTENKADIDSSYVFVKTDKFWYRSKVVYNDEKAYYDAREILKRDKYNEGYSAAYIKYKAIDNRERRSSAYNVDILEAVNIVMEVDLYVLANYEGFKSSDYLVTEKKEDIDNNYEYVKTIEFRYKYEGIEKKEIDKQMYYVKENLKRKMYNEGCEAALIKSEKLEAAKGGFISPVIGYMLMEVELYKKK